MWNFMHTRQYPLPLPVRILRVHPSTKKPASFSAKYNKCRVYFSKIHHMDLPVYKIVWRLDLYSGVTEPQFSCLDLKQQFLVPF